MSKPEIEFGTRVQVYIQPSGAGAQNEGDNFSATIRELSLSGGEREVEEIKTLGNNEILRQNPMSPMDVEITLIKTDPRLAEAVLGGSDAQFKWEAGSAPIVVTGDFPRRKWRINIEASGENADDWAQRLLFVDALGLNMERSVDAEGFVEETISFRCSAGNFSETWTGSYTTNAMASLPNY